MAHIGVISYATAALFFLILTLLLITSWRGRLQGVLLVVVVISSALWAIAAAFVADSPFPATLLTVSLEVARDFLWAIFLIRLIKSIDVSHPPSFSLFRLLILLSWTLPLAILAILSYVLITENAIPSWLGYDLRIFAHVLTSIVILALVEQLYRNIPPENRWGVKYLCFGIGLIFVFDFYLYSDALLFKQLDVETWYARGFINAMAVPLIAVAVARNPEWSLDVFVSRGVVYYSSALFFSGVYLIAMAAGGYYLREYGGAWGSIGSMALLVAGCVLLIVILSSEQVRAHLRVFINKHFFNYKYDYREEWLGFIRRLSEETGLADIEGRSIRSLAHFVDSPAGMLWLRKNEKYYVPVAELNYGGIPDVRELHSGPLVRFLETWQWVINLNECQDDPEMYQGLELPRWLSDDQEAWLVVPLLVNRHLYGFVVLAKPRAPRDFDWEDIDLLRTAGRQVAIHLSQAQATKELIQARQFEAFNRLSAYVMHDLKNLMSQLSLIVKNAEKHKHNPAFMDDAIITVDNAVGRMNRLLAQLRAGSLQTNGSQLVDLKDVISLVVKDKANGKPGLVPLSLDSGLFISVDVDRLVSIIGHVVQNAQDATPESGKVTVSLTKAKDNAIVDVTDTGCGMDVSFIENRLFEPFDTTKGLTGMGIGAHEVKAFIEQLGGEVRVDSVPKKGTSFRLIIPCTS